MDTRNESEMLENKYYKRYWKNKQKIKSKYGNIFTTHGNRLQKGRSVEEMKLWRKYLTELGDEMFKPNGHYHKFVWDTMAQSMKRFDRWKVND